MTPAASAGADVSVRPVGPDDWRTWRALRLRALREDPAAFGSDLADWSTAPEQRWRDRLAAPAACLVAELDGTPCGMVAVSPLDAGGLELFSLWVAPEARRLGVAECLVRAVVEHAGAAPLQLHVMPANRAASALYERLGFVRDGVSAGGEVRMRLACR